MALPLGNEIFKAKIFNMSLRCLMDQKNIYLPQCLLFPPPPQASLPLLLVHHWLHAHSQLERNKQLRPWPHRASALMLLMVHINLYVFNPHQTSASYPFSSIDASVNADTDANADTRCGQGLSLDFVACI